MAPQYRGPEPAYYPRCGAHLTIKCVDLFKNPIPNVTVTVPATVKGIILHGVIHVDYVAVTDKEGKANIRILTPGWATPYVLTALSYVAEHPAYENAVGTIDPNTDQVVTISMHALEG